MKNQVEKQKYTMHTGEIIDREVTEPINIGNFQDKPLYVKFYTYMSEIEVGAYDFDFFSPSRPLKIEDYDRVYDLFKSGVEAYLKHGIEEQNKKARLDFIVEMYNYQQLTPLLKVEIDKFLEKNPQFVYGRIFS